jgi:hypothetical protein
VIDVPRVCDTGLAFVNHMIQEITSLSLYTHQLTHINTRTNTNINININVGVNIKLNWFIKIDLIEAQTSVG